MDDYEEEEKRKRRAGVGIDIEREAAPRPQADEQERPQRPVTEFSSDSIKAEPLTAVSLGIPANADKALLQEAYAAVMQCCTYMAGPQGPSMNDDDPLGIGADERREQYFERAVRRLDELDGRLRAAEQSPEIEIENARNGEKVSADLATPEGRAAAADFLNDIAAIKIASERAAGEPPDTPPITREAIERDPWNAVDRWIPDDAAPELLELIATTARDLRPMLEQRAEEAVTPEQQDLWRDFADAAADRQKEAETLILAIERTKGPWYAFEHTDGTWFVADGDDAMDHDGKGPVVVASGLSKEDAAYIVSIDARQNVDDLGLSAELSSHAEERDTIALAEAIDDDQRRHRDDPDALRESAREDRFSSDRIDEARQSGEETAEPLYDRYTGELLSEAGQEHEAGHDLGGGGRGRGLSP